MCVTFNILRRADLQWPVSMGELRVHDLSFLVQSAVASRIIDVLAYEPVANRAQTVAGFAKRVVGSFVVALPR